MYRPESQSRVPNTSLRVQVKNIEACQVSGLWNPGVGRLPFRPYWSCFVVLGRYHHLPAGICLRYHSTKCITGGQVWYGPLVKLRPLRWYDRIKTGPSPEDDALLQLTREIAVRLDSRFWYRQIVWGR